MMGKNSSCACRATSFGSVTPSYRLTVAYIAFALPPHVLCAPPRTGSLLCKPNDHIAYFGGREEYLAKARVEATSLRRHVHSWRRLLFTELPRRVLLGNSVGIERAGVYT